MNKTGIGALLVGALLVVGGVVYANRSTDDKMVKNEVMTSASPVEAMVKPEVQDAMAMKKDAGAAFVTYTSESDAQNLVKDHGKTVAYFFDASWCPDCQAIQKKLESADSLATLDKNLVVVKVDYDKQADLKKKYGITHQTAFVKIDETGKSVKQEILSTFDDIKTF